MEICQSANIQQYKPKYHSNKQQYRNKIKDLSSFQFFYLAVVFCLFICWHSQTFLATTYNSYTLIFVSWLRLRNRIAYRCSQKEKDGLWFLPYIFIGTCVLHKRSCFYKTIGIWKGKYACLNIVYFDLAYIRLMHKLNRIFGFFLSAF